MSDKGRWRSEMTAAYLARAASRAERDAKKKKLFADIAKEAEGQAAIIARSLEHQPGQFSPSLRSRIAAGLVLSLGPRIARPVLAASKVRGLSVYGAPLVAGHPTPTTVAAIGARHSGGGSGALRAAVFGVNDGLVSNASLVMGVAGASTSTEIILLTGVAGLLAGAFSMAAGEYVSMRTQREMYQHQIAQEKEELDLYPEEEAEELALIYEARGMPLDEARAFSSKLVADPARALDTLAREELGLNPEDLGSGVRAAFSSFAAFALGASVPLLPFLLGAGANAVALAALASGLALFFVGAALSLFSGRGELMGGLRMLLIGAAAGGATFLIGRLLGVAVG
jgi:VIT1/CCC1 family predicted Fe2+/Mn2+ transporter